MKVILLQDVDNVGDRNDVKKVAAGFARNFLIPKGLAVPADDENMKQLNHRLRFERRRQEKIDRELSKVADRVGGVNLEIKVRAGVDGKLYGSVTARQIAEKLSEVLKLEIDRKRIKLDTPIKQTGEYKTKIQLGPDKRVEIVLNVISDREPEPEVREETTAEPAAEQKQPAAVPEESKPGPEEH